MSGGDLRSYIKREKRMSEDDCRFYAAELVLALEHIHECKTVYRDMKPDNILISASGHIALADFGLADRLRQSRKSCKLSGRTGTPLYMAPEQLKKLRYSYSVDYWGLGVTLCECLTGKKPFKSSAGCINDSPKYGWNISQIAKSFLDGLLQKDPMKRLGTGPGKINDLKNHAFFRNVDWGKVENKVGIVPPFIPDPTMDYSQMSGQVIIDAMEGSNIEAYRFKLSPEQQQRFNRFDYEKPEVDGRREKKKLNRLMEGSFTMSHASSLPKSMFEESDVSELDEEPDVSVVSRRQLRGPAVATITEERTSELDLSCASPSSRRSDNLGKQPTTKLNGSLSRKSQDMN
eukprot:1000192_1